MNYKTTIIFTILTISALFLLSREHGQRIALQKLLDVKSSEVETWKDKHGLSHARAMSAESDLKTLSEYYQGEIWQLYDKVEGLKKDLKNLKSATGVSTVTEGEVVTVIVRGEPEATVHSFEYSDSWASIRGEVSADSLKMRYMVTDSIVFATYYKSKGFLKGKQLYIEGVSLNPNTRITGISNIQVGKDKPKRFSLGVGVNYGLGVGFSAGASIHYSLLRF